MTERNRFREGMKLCLANADLWFNEADKLYKQRSYGHACALLIHGAEALVQAFYCWLVVLEVKKPEDKEVLGVFKEHKIKLQSLFGFFLAVATIQAFREQMNMQPQKTVYTREEIDREFQAISEGQKTFVNDMMGLRNLGIYVDYDAAAQIFKAPTKTMKNEFEALWDHIMDVDDIVRGLIFKTPPDRIVMLCDLLKSIAQDAVR